MPSNPLCRRRVFTHVRPFNSCELKTGVILKMRRSTGRSEAPSCYVQNRSQTRLWNPICKEILMKSLGKSFLFAAVACAAVVFLTPHLRSETDTPAPTFTQTNLVSDVAGMA